MAEKKKLDEIKLDKLDIEIDEKNFNYMEKNVKVVTVEVEKKGIYYLVYDSNNEKIATVDSNNKIKFSKEFKERLGDNFEKLGLDSKTIEIDITEKIKEQKEKNKNLDKDNIKEEDVNNKDNRDNKDNKDNKEEKEENKNKEENKKEKDEEDKNKDKETLDEEKKEKEQKENELKQKRNKEVRKKIKEENGKLIKDEHLKNFDRIEFNDVEVKDRLVDSGDLDPSTVKIFMINNKPKLFAKYRGSDYYKMIETKSEKDASGEIDSIDNRKEKKAGKGRQITFSNKSGNNITLDVQMNKGGKPEVRYIDDFNKDGNQDGIVLDTGFHKSSVSAEKVIRESEVDKREGMDNQEKEKAGIETISKVEESYTGSLSDKQIKQILEERDIPEQQWREIIAIISEKYPNEENPNKQELDDIIDGVMDKVDEEDLKKEQDEHVHEHTHKGGPSWV